MIPAAAETPRLLEQAMRRAGRVAAQAAEEHRRDFALQMREKTGAEAITLREPYLPALLVRAQLRYLRRLAVLEQRLPARKEEGGEEESAVAGQIDAETNRAVIEIKQDFDAARQQAFGLTHYVWVGGDCSLCAPNNGEVFAWGEGDEPGGIHLNCNCSAEPTLEGADTDDPPIEPVYPVETLLGLLAGQGLARQLGLLALRRLAGEEVVPVEPEQMPNTLSAGENPPAGGRTDTQWMFGKHKSDAKWENQMEKRGWTQEKITDAIKNGKGYPAPNKVNPGNGATRYEKDGKFIVRDDKTGEILQIGDDGFKPNQL